MRRLPSLNALRAFEAAARHQHIARAAAELHVTHGAVSHQIRHLESLLGTTLFLRSGNRITLTPAAQRLLPVLSESFDRIARVIAGLDHADEPDTITIACAPALAAKWLMPEMAALIERHPGISVDIAPNQETVWLDDHRDIAAIDADIILAYGRIDSGMADVLSLPEIRFFPVCSPRLTHGPQALRRPQDVLGHTLLHDDNGAGWRRWLEAAGVETPEDSRDMRLGNASLSLGAAADGLGIALGDTILADADLAAGRLVAPFSIRVAAPGEYFILRPPGVHRAGTRDAVANWLADRLSARLV